MNIAQFNQTNCKEVKAAVNAALKLIGDQFGIDIQTAPGRYGDNEFRFKVECNTRRVAQVHIISANQLIPVNPNANQVKPGMPILKDQTFMHRGTRFTIIEVKHNRPKYKFIAVNARGTRYKWSEQQVRGISQF